MKKTNKVKDAVEVVFTWILMGMGLAASAGLVGSVVLAGYHR